MRGVMAPWALWIALSGCATPREAQPDPPPLRGPAELRIDVHENSVGVIYEYERLLERLEQDGGGAARVELHEDDVRRYVVGPEPSPMLALHLTDAASRRWRAAFPSFAETKPFAVTVGGKHLFSGVLYPAIGAAAIQSPVVHATDYQGRVVLTIGAQQGTAYLGGAPVEAARRIDRPELRALFRKRGALEEEPQPPRPLGH